MTALELQTIAKIFAAGVSTGIAGAIGGYLLAWACSGAWGSIKQLVEEFWR